MPELANAVEAAGHHGGCAEVGCLIKAYNAEGANGIRGGSMRVLEVRHPTSSKAKEHGRRGVPCGRCKRLLNSLKIKVKAKPVVKRRVAKPKSRKK